MTKIRTIAWCVGAAVLLAGRPGRADPAVELEATLLGQGTVYAAVGGGGWGGGGVLLGLPLGERSVLMTGLQAQAGGSEVNGTRSSLYAITVPLMLKVYVRAPAAGRVVPILRLGAAYSRIGGTMGGVSYSYGAALATEVGSHELQGLGSAGLSYFVTPRLAFSVEGGVRYSRWLNEDGGLYAAGESNGWSLAATWQAALVLRI